MRDLPCLSESTNSFLSLLLAFRALVMPIQAFLSLSEKEREYSFMGLHFISHQNGSKLGTHLFIDANETEEKRKSRILNSVHHGKTKN
jgi:hypothetical protein